MESGDRKKGPRLVAAVLAWYATHGRPLTIRTLRDPYAIWIAEAMSQQTRIARVEEALPRFLERFPSMHALADASVADVIRAWVGLGYDRRAVALRRAAEVIVRDHGGALPTEPALLERLPGIGPYTARAVAAFAYGVPVTALDVNAERVLGRALGTTARRELQGLADGTAPSDRAGDWNHALMDLAAAVCRPVPRCAECPIRTSCAWAANAKGHAADPPSRRRPPAVPRFGETTRWLRGRLVNAMRERQGDGWVTFEGPLGSHGAAAVERALAALERDGLVERDASGRARLRGHDLPSRGDDCPSSGGRGSLP